MPNWGRKKEGGLCETSRSFLLLQHGGNQQVETYLEHIFKHIRSYINIYWTGSSISYQKISKQRNRDENIWKKYEEKVYAENIKINIKNIENVEKKLN